MMVGCISTRLKFMKLIHCCAPVLLCAGGVGSGPVSFVCVWLGGLSRAVYAGCTGAGQSGLCEAVDWEWSEHAPLPDTVQTWRAL